MKKFVSILFVIPLIWQTAFSQGSYIQRLQNVATITFPDTPQTKTVNSVRIYVARNSQAVYMAESNPLESGFKDLISKGYLDSVYTGFMSGALGKTNGKVFYQNKTKINKLNGFEFGYTTQVKNKKYFIYNRVVYLNDNLISFAFMSADSLKKNDKGIAEFFGTFRLTIKEDEVRQVDGELGYKAGNIVGYFLVLTVIAMIGLGIVFLIKRIF